MDDHVPDRLPHQRGPVQLRRDQRPDTTTDQRLLDSRGDAGWVYTIRSLDVANRQLKQLLFERQGTGLDYPGLVITADSASWDDSVRNWRVRDGASRVIVGPGKQAMFTFTSMRLRALTQSPADLLAEAIETGRRDPVAVGALRAAAALIGPDGGPS